MPQKDDYQRSDAPAIASRLRIVHVVDSLEFGGLERVVTDLAIAQKARGDAVSVFSINATAGFSGELRGAGIPVLIGDKRRSWDRQVMRALRAHAASADVVHAHNFVPNYYAAAAFFGRLNRPVQVSTCHDMGSRLSNRKLRWLYRWSLTRTERVAMVGQQVHDRFVQGGIVRAQRASTVLNGIPTARFADAPERRDAARRALGLAPSDLVIGCVGRLVALKNHALVIRALPALLGTIPQARLVIVGEGELDGELRALVTSLQLDERVHFAGRRSDVAALLPAFDVFAMPSLTEGLSIALLEACATRLAVVATSVGGNPEIIHHDRTGLLVPPADLEATTDALRALLGAPDLRARLGTAAAQWVREHASIDALSNTYDRFYRDAGAKAPA